MTKLKPLLTMGVIAIVAVYVFNRFIGPRLGLTA